MASNWQVESCICSSELNRKHRFRHQLAIGGEVKLRAPSSSGLSGAEALRSFSTESWRAAEVLIKQR